MGNTARKAMEALIEASWQRDRARQQAEADKIAAQFSKH